MTNDIVPISDVRESVRDFYAARARNSDSCCSPTSGNASGGSCCATNPFHSDALLEGIPEDVASFTLGCGDAVSLAQVRPGETVIDLGSGGGLECFIAAKQTGDQGRVIGIDMTPEMLSKAWANAAKIKSRNVEFRSGFLEALPVQDNTADVIMSNCVINLSPDKPQVFREMFRVLKPGGRIAVSDVVANGELTEEMRQDMALWGACFSGALDMTVYSEQLRDAGFTEIRIDPKGGVADEIPVLKGQIFSAAITAIRP